MNERAAPDPASLAIAQSMRRFDTRLTDGEIAEIAAAIAEDARSYASLHAKKYSLDNAVAPIATVRAQS